MKHLDAVLSIQSIACAAQRPHCLRHPQPQAETSCRMLNARIFQLICLALTLTQPVPCTICFSTSFGMIFYMQKTVCRISNRSTGPLLLLAAWPVPQHVRAESPSLTLSTATVTGLLNLPTASQISSQCMCLNYQWVSLLKQSLPLVRLMAHAMLMLQVSVPH